MQFKSLIAMSMLAASCASAADSRDAARFEASGSEKSAAVYGGPRTRVSMWIWSDKYVYQPGQQLTLRWTVKTNSDLYTYTVLAYRQNNQNGVKYYLPGGTEEVTDIDGNNLARGFQPMQMSDANKAVLIGPGGKFPAISIPNEPGMHTIAVELRDYTGTRVLKTAYMKIGVVTKRENLTGEITSSRLLTNDTEWHVQGAVFVKNNATLSIEPGTFIIGEPGSQPPSVLVVTRNGQINAYGTASRPIVMSSSQPFGQRKRGDWGGLILLGKAPVNVGANTAGNQNPAGTFFIEGLNATEDGLYGGSDANHSCGTLRYVRVEYAGSILSPNNETNSFTFGGCGKGTVADHLQATYGLDDSFEWFGGTADAKYLVGGLGADDFVDYQLGYTGRIQHGIFYQSPDARGNRGLEGDNSEYNQGGEPYSNPTIFNATFIGSGQPGYDESNAPGIFARRGSRGSINNILVTNFYSGAVEITDANTQAQADASRFTMNGVLMWNNNIGSKGENTVAGQIPHAYTQAFAQGQKGTPGQPAGRNFLAADPLLSRPFEYSDPDFTGLFGSPLFRAGFVAPPDDNFFDQAVRHIGGVGDESWWEGWTSFLVETDIAP